MYVMLPPDLLPISKDKANPPTLYVTPVKQQNAPNPRTALQVPSLQRL